MISKGYINDFYKRLEELNNKLDKANSTILNMSLTIKELNENKNLTPIIKYEYDIEVKRKVTKYIIYY